MRKVVADLPDTANFAPFGTLLAGDGTRAAAFNGRTEAVPTFEMRVVRDHAIAGQQLTLMERHPHSTQTFVPLGGAAYLVVAAKGGDEGPDLDTLRAFVFTGDSGFQYAAGIWHAPMAVLAPPASFIFHVNLDGTSGDCEFRDIEPVIIDFSTPVFNSAQSGPAFKAG